MSQLTTKLIGHQKDFMKETGCSRASCILPSFDIERKSEGPQSVVADCVLYMDVDQSLMLYTTNLEHNYIVVAWKVRYRTFLYSI